MTTDQTPTMLRIAEVVSETDTIKSFTFNYDLGAKPGQFVMVWFPGVNQKPMSVGMCTKDSFTLTIAAVGSCSEAICKLRAGDRLGIQGPYGTSYEIPSGEHVAMVAGGYGAAPLYFASTACLENTSTVDFIIGARTGAALIYQQKLKTIPLTTHVMTNDGSAGEKGLATEKLEQLLKTKKITSVMTCGPELMQYRVVELCKEYGVFCQVSLERYMKCGFGLCGACCVDPTGQPTCLKGPVLSDADAAKVTEFGKYHRDAAGTKHSFA